MKAENVKIGDRVVPHDKTVKGWGNFSEWLKVNANYHRGLKEFIQKGYCTVEKKSDVEDGEEPNTYILGGDYFNASDFEPYIEPVKDNGIKKMLTRGNRTVVFLAGSRKGVSVCSPSDTFDPVKGLALAYARALGQTADDIRIEINPEQTASQEDKPLMFEVGEMVTGKDKNCWLHGGEAVITEINGCDITIKITKKGTDKHNGCPPVGAIDRGWQARMLEKVPQPTKLEVYIGGAKYVREAE